MYRHALAIDEANLGVDHPSVAIRLNNLGSLLRATNRLAEVEPLFRHAVIILQRSLGSEHPSSKTVCHNYRLCLIALGKSETEAQASVDALVAEHGGKA